MRIFQYFLLIILFFVFGHVHAQKSLYYSKNKSIRISKQKAQVVCPIFQHSEYPYHGLGIKVGDPVTLTYKYYQSEKFAIAIDAGSAASGLYTKHHRESFTSNLTDALATITDIQYVRHEVINEYVVEGKLLLQQKADKLFPGLQTYVGAGWQYRKIDIKYYYFYEFGLNERESGNFDSYKTTHGPVVAAGLEYAYFSIPISAFVETSLFYDVSAEPGWTRFQGGVGIRYVF